MMSPVFSRLARNGTALAWLPVVVLPPLLVLDAGLTHEGPGVGAAGVAAAVVACLPLVLRSRLRFAVMAPLLTAGIVLVLWQLEPGNTVVAIPMVALAELGLRGDRRQSLWVALAVGPCVTVSVLPFADSAADLAGIVIRNFALCLLALAAGDIARSRREAIERRVVEQREGERLRIAREVHDVVAHALAGINVQAGVAAHLIDEDPEQARSALRAIKAASGEALTDLRATLRVLRDADEAPVAPPTDLNDLDQLTPGLRAAGIQVDLQVADVGPVPAAVHAAGYRIVQEALTNVLRHAEASAVRVTVAQEDGGVRLEVVDNGVGTGARGSGGGHGLRGMAERAAALDGTLEAGPAPSGGWRVCARLPVHRAGAGAPA
jgi:signal transduction histidine kinase